MRYTFDETGSVIGFSTHYPNFTNGYWEDYLFAKNLQGDVVAMYLITVEPPKLVATYEYDEWGKVKTVRDAAGAILTNPAHLANRNPFRYRSYHYDNETGFYYLQSRYYDPIISRFINADSYGSTGQGFLGTNMFAYCNNNPVSMSDFSGNLPQLFPNATAIAFKIIAKKIVDVIKNAGIIKHEVPLYEQGYLKLCWAYCQVMVESYKNKTILTQKEADKRAKEIAISVHGQDNWNKGGWPTNIGKQFSSITRFSLFFKLKKGPLYGYYAGDKGAHLIVITGINIWTGTVYTNNPWGYSGEQSIEEFKQGFVKMSSESDMPLICIYGVN